MRRLTEASVIGVALGALTLQAAGDPVFYGIQGASPNNLVEIDVGRRTVTPIGPAGVVTIDDMAQDSLGNLVIVASEGDPVPYSVAYFLNSTTGASTRLAAFDLQTRTLLFDDDAGQFRAMPEFPKDLVSLDPATGTYTTIVGPHTIENPSALTAITLAPDGTMYGSHLILGTRNYELMRIDAGARLGATLIGPIGDGTDGNLSGGPINFFYALSVEALAFDPASGILYTVNWQNGDIYTIDTATGAGSFLFGGGQAARRITGLVYKGPSDVVACPCEFDGDPAQVDVFDLLDYLSLWFAQDPGAELDGDPAQVDVFDLLAYLDCWFDASASGICP